MAASADDRRFMERIGHYKEASHASATGRHLARSVAGRLQSSWDLYLTYRSAPTVRNRYDDPSPFYERARKLGLYKNDS